MSKRALALSAAVLAAISLSAGAAVATTPQHLPVQGRFDQPQHGYMPASTTLRDGSPQSVGLDPAPIDAAMQQVDDWTKNDPTTGHPLFSGAVTLLAHDGKVVSRHATGEALRYADQSGTELPADQQIPMRNDTIFDMASISKMFTVIVALQQMEKGRIGLYTPVAQYLPEFATNGKGTITIEQLLTHTSGLAPDPVPSLWEGYPDIPSRRKAVLDAVPANPPGTVYTYSDLNMLTLQQVVEQVGGKPLDVLVRDGITAPLGMKDTMYNPPASLKPRIAAEEYELTPDRGLVWGQVHDENAWALGGVAGHAGVFSTAQDMATLGQALLNGGTYGGHQILKASTVREMLTNYNQKFPDDSHGLGFELDQRWYMGALDSTQTYGHTGFTGTTLVVDPVSRSIAIFLSNHVHPNRNWGSVNIAREAVADGLARAMAVQPADGKDAWYSGIGNKSEATLTTAPLSPHGATKISFDTFVDTESTDLATLESSTDGGQTWNPVPMRVKGPGAPTATVTTLSGGTRAWWKVQADLPQAQQLQVRWRYTTDTSYLGRGVYVDGVRISDQRGTLLDGERNPSALTGVNWQLSAR